MKKVLILFLLSSMILLTHLAKALDVTATNGSAVAIQAAVDQVAAAGGGTVYIPAGTWYWNGETVYITNGGVNLIGASLAGCSGHESGWTPYQPTTILHNIQSGPMINAGYQTHGQTTLKPMRISGIQFEADPPANVTQEDAGGASPIFLRQIPNFRIDHNTFINWASSAIGITSNDGYGDVNVSSYGVIDHNIITNPYKLTPPPSGGWAWAYGIIVTGTIRTDDKTLLQEWDENAQDWFGYYGPKPESSVVYIEDNNFSLCRHDISSNSNAFYTARFNLIDQPACKYTAGAIDVHGAAFPSGRGFIAYNNTIFGAPGNVKPWNNTDSYYSAAVDLRGGSSLVYNNSFICDTYSPYNYFLLLSDGDYVPSLPFMNISQTYVWDNTYTDSSFSSVPSDIVLNTDYFTRAPNQTQDNFTYTPYPYPHPLTLEGTTYYSVTGKLVDKSNNPVQANMIAYQNGTNTMFGWTQTNSSGYYSLQLPNGTYDILFNLTNFFVPNYSIKLNSINITNDTYDLIKSITGNQSANTVSIVLDMNDSQNIQIYSPNAPTKIKKNNTYISNVSSLSQLSKNTWFYQSPNLYLMVSPEFIVTAASGHPADIQTAVDAALAAGGGTVYIPAGDWQFDEAYGPSLPGPGAVHGGAVTIDLETLPPGGWLNIIGSSYNVTTTTNTGQTITCPATILRSTVGNPASGSIVGFAVRGSNWTATNQDYQNSVNKHIRISGITILGTVTNDTGNNNDGIDITYVDGYLIDHCCVDSHVGFDIGLTASKGVVSHCQILQTYHLNLGGVWGYGIGVSGNSGLATPTWICNLSAVIGKYDWQGIPVNYSNPATIFMSWYYHQGTADYNNYTISSLPYTTGPDYIEDSYFSYMRHGIASNDYGFYVARHNLFNYSLTGMPLPYLDVHGVGSPSGRGYEAYDNTFINNPLYGVDMTGGGGAIFNNTFIGMTSAIDIGVYWYNASVWDPQYPLDIWIWNNVYSGVTNKVLAWTSEGITNASFYSDVAATDYDTGGVLSGTPTVIQPPRPDYVPYPYPHPLTLNP